MLYLSKWKNLNFTQLIFTDLTQSLNFTVYHKLLTVVLITCSLTGCGAKAKNKQDPLERLNRTIYWGNRAIDAMYIKPTSYIYKKVTPSPVKAAVGDFLANLGEVPTTANQTLQGNGKKAASSLSRFVINSTLGLFGLFDVATPMGLPRHKEDFGQTLATWGYRDSTYIVLPILGPSTIRDTAGIVGNSFMSIPTYLKPKWRNRHLAANAIHTRAELSEVDKLVKIAGVDEYAFVRNAYLQKRDYEIKSKAENDAEELNELEGPPE